MIAIRKAMRQAPEEKASTYDEGFITMGNYENKYIVTVDKNGNKRWIKMKKEVFFEAHDEEPVKPKRTYKKKVVGEEPQPQPLVEEPQPIVEVPHETVKPKRTYMKKVVGEEPQPVKQYAEMGTQTENTKKTRQPKN